MENITHSDLLIIYQGAWKMARAGTESSPVEQTFLEELRLLGQIDTDEADHIHHASTDSLLEMVDGLSSTKARRVFLLAVAAMALADRKLEVKEIKLLQQLTEKLDVGKVKLEETTFQPCRAMVLKYLKQVKIESDEKDNSPTQLSDLDLLS